MQRLYKDYRDIWTAFNHSGKLGAMKKVLKREIVASGAIYREDRAGNLLIGNFEQEKPCLVAHMDSVHIHPPGKIAFDGERLSAKNGIGADDKAGLVAVLEIIRRGADVNAIFTADEEIGGRGASAIDPAILKGCCYFVEIDRRGNSDLVSEIGWQAIASDKFIEIVTPFALEYGFKETSGMYTDIEDILQKTSVSGLNVSAGYYNPHTVKEFVLLSELQNSIDFVFKLVSSIRARSTAPEKRESISCFEGFRASWAGHFDGTMSAETLPELEDEIYYSYNVRSADDIVRLVRRAYEIGRAEGYADAWEDQDRENMFLANG